MARAVLTDLDRTLTGPDLRLDPRVPGAVDRLERAGVRVVVVTGRPLAHVVACGLAARASAVVAENGAVVHHPALPAPQVAQPAFGTAIRRALGPLSARFRWEQVLGSGPRELADEALRAAGAGGVPCVAICNAEEAMLLPPGIDKGSGARAVLAALGVAPGDAVAIGDGDNDVDLFRAVGASAAPANASPAAMRAATRTLRGAYADGFLELAEEMLRLARPAGPS